MNPKDPRATKGHFKATQGYFDTTVDRWDNLYEGVKFVDLHMKDRKKIVLGLVKEYSNGNRLKLLDIGCGTGILTRSLLEQQHMVVGLDCAPNMIAKLDNAIRIDHFKYFLGAVLGSAVEVPFTEGVFDGIICVGVFQYQLNDDLLMKEISRLVRKGGFCIFTLPNLLRMNYVLDPLLYLRFIRRLLGRLLRKRPISGVNYSHGNGDMNKQGKSCLVNKKYFLWELNKSIDQHGLRIRRIVGFGYGPFTMMGRQIGSEDTSIRISDWLNKWTDRYPFLKLVSNRWVFVVEKKWEVKEAR